MLAKRYGGVLKKKQPLMPKVRSRPRACARPRRKGARGGAEGAAAPAPASTSASAVWLPPHVAQRTALGWPALSLRPPDAHQDAPPRARRANDPWSNGPSNEPDPLPRNFPIPLTRCSPMPSGPPSLHLPPNPHPQDIKYFDSADWALAKEGKGEVGGPTVSMEEALPPRTSPSGPTTIPANRTAIKLEAAPPE